MDQAGLGSRAIIGRFYNTLEQNLGGSWVDKVGMKFDSNQESEEYKWLGMSPMLREWLGNREANNLREQGLTIKNLTFEGTLEIDVDDMRRDKTGQIQVRIDELADRATDHWAKLLSTLILTSETALCYDGQAFFDTDHSEGDSGTQTNDLSASDYSALNVTTPTDPTADELATIILKMIQHQYSYKDDKGEPMNGEAKNFLVQVPVSFWASALQAVTKNNLNTGSGVRENPLISDAFNVEVSANPRLTWTTKLAVYRTDARTAPYILQEEQDVTMSAIAEDSEEEFKNNRHLYGVKAIRNVGFGYWQQATLGTLS